VLALDHHVPDRRDDTAQVGAHEPRPSTLPCPADAHEPTSYRRQRERAPKVGDSLPPPGRQENAETQRQVLFGPGPESCRTTPRNPAHTPRSARTCSSS